MCLLTVIFTVVKLVLQVKKEEEGRTAGDVCAQEGWFPRWRELATDAKDDFFFLQVNAVMLQCVPKVSFRISCRHFGKNTR